MKHVSLILVAVLLPAVVAFASDQIPAPPQAQPIALVGATVHPVSSPPLENATVLFSGGKITAIGKDVTIPDDAERIDVRGRHIYPGLIDAYSAIGLTEVGSVRGTNDVSEVGRINPNVRAEVAVNAGSEIIPVTRANGITLALVAPRGGTLSGRSALMMMDGWTWEDMVLKAPVAMHLSWPRMTIVHAWWMSMSDEEQIKERDRSLEALRSAFRDARAYMKAKQAESQKSVPFHKTDLRWEAMIPVFEKKLPLMVTANNIQEIQAAVAWAQQENLNVIILGGNDAWRATDLLAAADIPVIVQGIHELPSRHDEGYDTPFTLPRALHDAGIRYCIAGGGASNERNLPYQAATAAAYGLPKDEALKAVTLYPAQILGVADRVGSLEVGKDATLIVTTGDPLETASQVEREYIQGRDIDLTSRHTMLYDKYKTKYRQLR